MSLRPPRGNPQPLPQGSSEGGPAPARSGVESVRRAMEAAPPSTAWLSQDVDLPTFPGTSRRAEPDGSWNKECPSCGGHYPPEFRVCPRDASPLQDAASDADPLLGTVLSETYRLVRVIGEGGMGRVFEAHHTRIGSKRFAVKVLHPEYARNAEVQSRFQREAEAAATIVSPYVGDVIDVGRTSDGRPFLVADFLEGVELAELLIDREPLEIPLAIRVVRHICRGLAAAHQSGIIHRDMKPENVFLTGGRENTVAKVIDFGISKIRDNQGHPSLTKTGIIMGTPSYMAPEQANGEKVDHRVDVYATGAILYELVTGRRPFERPDPTSTLTAVLFDEPTRPSAINPRVPQALELVIQRAMSKSVADRYPTMEAFEAALLPFAPDREAETARTELGLPGVNPDRLDAHRSRPMIVLLGVAGTYFALFGIMTVVAAVIRQSRGGSATANLTGPESLLLLVFVTLTLATPIAFGAWAIARRVWTNTAKSVEFYAKMRGIVLPALVAYGVVSLGIRFVEGLILREAGGIAWPWWDVINFSSAALVGVLAGLIRRA